MRVEHYQGDIIRRIVAAIATDRIVCSRIASQWRTGGLFDCNWANLVAGWCINFFRKYGDVPGLRLRELFIDWASKSNPPRELAENIEAFIAGLKPESFASTYILDLAGRYFNRVRVRSAIEEAEAFLEQDNPDSARQVLISIDKLELGQGALVKPAEDFTVWQEAFDDEQQKPLLRYPGILDDFFRGAMVRDNLISFMAPDKSGKTMWLIDAAFRAIRNRRKVAYFECGDLGQRGVLIRIGCRAARKPRWPGTYQYPIGFSEDGQVLTKSITFDEGLDDVEAYESYRDICRGADLLRLSCYPNSTLSVRMASEMLHDWEREGWVADVVIFDYADIMAPPYGTQDTLEQIDVLWKELRRLSQEFHCLVLTATQASAEAYRASVLKRYHFSGRKTKLAHVNGMIGLNVSDENRAKNVTQLNWIVRREDRYDERYLVTVAGCWAIANPCIRVLGSENRKAQRG